MDMTPLALLGRLNKALDTRAAAVAEAEAWYDGDHPIPPPPHRTLASVDAEARAAFDLMCRLAITNFMPPVVDVPAASLHVEGFTFGESPIAGDRDAWSIWQRNGMDADSDLAIHTALKTGQSFALVWADDDGKATITAEDPSQCIVMYEAGHRRRRLAGLKRWVDEDGRLMATLYTRSAVYKFIGSAATSTAGQLWTPPGSSAWTAREIPSEPWPLPNPYGFVPLHEVRANPTLKPTLYGGGTPEFAGQLNEQRKVNQTIMNLLTTTEAQSFRQRWVTGWGIPTKADGTPDELQAKRASASMMWTFEDDKVKVGEFSQADLRPILDVAEFWVGAISTSSGTPPYAFTLGSMMNVAADTMARIEGIKTGKVKSHARFFGEDITEMVRSALKVENNPKASDGLASVVWGEFEERTATEQANLAQIKKGLNVPMRDVYATLPGVSQQQADRWVTEALADDLRRAVATPEATAPDSPAVEVPGAP